MKNIFKFSGIIFVILSGCSTTEKIPKSIAYKGMYDEKPLTVLIMPPINRTINVECKDYFHSTLHVPLANAGFYVIPPFLSMEILKRESAYDSEMFINSPSTKFGEVFGADLCLFTIIHKWDKSLVASNVYIEVEYILKSTKTNEIVYSRKGNFTYDTSVHTMGNDVWEILIDMAASAIITAATQFINVARECNSYTFKDLPAGKYSPNYGTDGGNNAGKKQFNVRLKMK